METPSAWRSVLFAPANRPDLTAKLPRSAPDAVILDLEDSVPAPAKEQARAAARAAVADLAGPGAPAVLVRVNPVGSPWFAGDVEGVAGPGLAGLVVPKLESAAQVAGAAGALAAAGCAEVGIVAGIETARGVWDVASVLVAPVVACYFGAEDLVADVGGRRTPEGREVLYARSRVALAARLAGVAALDMIVPDLHDDDRFARECAEARALGYRGKMCIHPRQVPLATAGFRPSDVEVTEARALLAAYREARARGEAAVAHAGRMVDEPLAAQARALLAAAGESQSPTGHDRS